MKFFIHIEQTTLRRIVLPSNTKIILSKHFKSMSYFLICIILTICIGYSFIEEPFPFLYENMDEILSFSKINTLEYTYQLNINITR